MRFDVFDVLGLLVVDRVGYFEESHVVRRAIFHMLGELNKS